MENLQYKSVLSFILTIKDCKTGKEGLEQRFLSLIKKQEERSVFMGRWIRSLHSDNIVLEYSGAPFANLTFCNKMIISDSCISYTYEENTNQGVMLPNMIFFVKMLLLSFKVVEKENGDLIKHHIECGIKVENNTDCYFYEKYSPLEVDYSRMLKYCLAGNDGFTITVESRDDMYIAINRFYQKFQSAQSMQKPYVTVEKESFDQMYDGLE